MDDYLNDLDGRQLLEEALAVAPKEQKEAFLKRVHHADELMKSLVESTERCLWGEEVAEAEGWTPKKNWWYFSKPINATPLIRLCCGPVPLSVRYVDESERIHVVD